MIIYIINALIFVFSSFGQNAIFLLGGQERSERALAYLLVQSGYIVIMSGAKAASDYI
jgi:alkylated DNA repair dioxygenase AlkB